METATRNKPVKTILMLIVALCLGGCITYIDSRPTWDDTGVTAAALFVCAAVFGFVRPRWAWAWALALGLWIPLVEVLRAGNYGSLLALLFAFAGAYGGMLLRKATLHVSA
jgi:hypothetical protein